MTKSEKQSKQEAPANDDLSGLEKTARSAAPNTVQERESELLQENAALAKENEDLKQQNTELVDQIQRLQAEFINYRNRADREAEANRNAAGEKLLMEFLAISDSLQLALQHAKDAEGKVKGDDLLAGITMINSQVQQLLEQQGLAEIPAEGKFDPRLHEALMTVPHDGAKGMIIQTFQRGYLLNGKPFRPAKVSVAK
jgi:molecular chaperone GrpE